MESIIATALGQDPAQLAAAEKRDLLARLLGRLAHEIRNPLSSLDIHVQLLEEDLSELDSKLKDRTSPRLEIIHGELHRLKSIVTQFLRLAGPSALDIEPVDISRVLMHVCELLKPEAALRQITIAPGIPGSLPVVEADPVKLTQAVLNLVINAMQAVERQGTVQVTATTLNQTVVIEVSDTGPGIPTDRLMAIFDPYFTTKEEGHGLGLWIAQQIATAHSGTLRASNKTGGGAVFSLALPLQQPTRVTGQKQEQLG